MNEFLQSIGINSYGALKSAFRSNDKDVLNFNNEDTGAITGSDAGGSVTKTLSSIIPENGTARDLSDSEYSSFNIKGLNVNITYDTKVELPTA